MPEKCETRTLVQWASKQKGGKAFFEDKEAGSVSESSLNTYRTHLGVAVKIAQEMHGKWLLDLNKAQVRKVAEKVREKKSGVGVGILTRMFYVYHEREDLAKVFKTANGKKKRMDPKELLTVEECDSLIRATSNLRDRAIISILWESGARIHEVLALKMENITLEEEGEKWLYRVFFGKVKVRGQERTCLLIESASHLKAWLDSYALVDVPQAPVFPAFDKIAIGGHLQYAGFRDSLRRSIKKAGIDKKIRTHLFRHSRATFLLREGWSDEMVNKYLGWTPGSTMLGTYAHLSNEDLERKQREMNGLESPEDTETPKIKKADLEGLTKTAPQLPLPTSSFSEDQSTDDLLNHPALVNRLDELIKARFEAEYGNWKTQVDTGKMSEAMDQRTDRISIAVKEAVQKVDKKAVVESIEVRFPEVENR